MGRGGKEKGGKRQRRSGHDRSRPGSQASLMRHRAESGAGTPQDPGLSREPLPDAVPSPAGVGVSLRSQLGAKPGPAVKRG